MIDKSWLIIFTAPFIIGIIGLTCVAIYFTSEGIQSMNWIPTEAIIEKIEIQQKRVNKSNTEKIVILYKYLFGKEEYQGNKICIGCEYGGGGEDQGEIYSKLVDANKIIIFVNPQKPNESVVARGISSVVLAYIFFSIIFLLPLLTVLRKSVLNIKLNLTLRVVFLIFLSLLIYYIVHNFYFDVNDITKNIKILESKEKNIDD